MFRTRKWATIETMSITQAVVSRAFLGVIISSLVNKNYYAKLYRPCVMFSLLLLRVRHFPCYNHYPWILNQKVFFQKKKTKNKRKQNCPNIFQSILCHFFISTNTAPYFFFLFYVEAHYLSKCHLNEYKRHVICCNTIQSLIQLNFFSVEKKLQNEYICLSDICLSGIITSSRIKLIIFSIKDFFSRQKVERYSCTPVLM